MFQFECDLSASLHSASVHTPSTFTRSRTPTGIVPHSPPSLTTQPFFPSHIVFNMKSKLRCATQHLQSRLDMTLFIPLLVQRLVCLRFDVFFNTLILAFVLMIIVTTCFLAFGSGPPGGVVMPSCTNTTSALETTSHRTPRVVVPQDGAIVA